MVVPLEPDFISTNPRHVYTYPRQEAVSWRLSRPRRGMHMWVQIVPRTWLRSALALLTEHQHPHHIIARQEQCPGIRQSRNYPFKKTLLENLRFHVHLSIGGHSCTIPSTIRLAAACLRVMFWWPLRTSQAFNGIPTAKLYGKGACKGFISKIIARTLYGGEVDHARRTARVI